MKRLFLFSALAFIYLNVFSQSHYDAFVGTWVYEKNDTVFKIKLQKGIFKYYKEKSLEALFGGYSLSVKGKLIDNYIRPISIVYNSKTKEMPNHGIYIWALSDPKVPNYAEFTFFDMKKKHAFGEGLPCNQMVLLSPVSLHWKLNEKEGVWMTLEGEQFDDEQARRTNEEMKLRGFSVPDDVIMIKEE